MIRVELPAHLRTLAGVNGEVTIEIEGQATQRSVLDALEARYPMLRGAIPPPIRRGATRAARGPDRGEI